MNDVCCQAICGNNAGAEEAIRLCQAEMRNDVIVTVEFSYIARRRARILKAGRVATFGVNREIVSIFQEGKDCLGALIVLRRANVACDTATAA